MTKIINIFGGPGVGKSGIAAGVFSKMKANHMQVEFAAEVAKDYVWEERFNILKNDQLTIFAKSHRQIDRLRNRVDYVITDCPLLMHIVYIPKGSYKGLEPLIVEIAQSFENINIVLTRAEKAVHTEVGRYHNIDEAQVLDREIKNLLDKYDPTYYTIPVHNNSTETIFNLLSRGCFQKPSESI